MPRYNVHCYHVVRSLFKDIEAESHEDAIEATRHMDFQLAAESEDAEEVTGWLVDVVGDDDYSNSIGFEADGQTWDSVRTFYVKAPDPNNWENNYDLIVRAYSSDDAEKIWREYYELGEDEIFPEHITMLQIHNYRGPVPWF